MPTKTARVRISASADSALGRVLRGVIDASGKASRAVASSDAAQSKASQAAQRKTADVTRQSIDEAKRALLDKAQTAESLARQELRAKERADKEAVRSAERAARRRSREDDRAAKDAIRNAQTVRRARMKLGAAVVGGGILGGAREAAAAVGRGQQLAGVGSLDERLDIAGKFRETLIRTANEANVSNESRARVEEQLLKASESTNVSIMDMVEGLATGQVRFDQFAKFAGIMQDIAEVAQATGEPVQDLVGAMGTMNQAFDLTSTEMQRAALDALISTSQRGTIGVGDVARDLAPTIGNFQAQTGRSGVGAAREFFALSQLIGGASQAGSAETATMIERLALELNDPKVQRKLRQNAGLKVTGDDGRLLPFGEISRMFSESDRFQTASRKGQIFGRVEAKKAAEFLVATLKRDPEAFDRMENIEEGAGLRSAQTGLAKLFEDPTFKLRNVGARAQADTIRDADRIVAKIAPAVERMTDLQTQFPLLTESMGTLEGTVRGMTQAFIAYRLAVGGLGAAGALTGAAGTAGASAVGVGALAAGGAAGVASLVAGALGSAGVGALVGNWLSETDVFKELVLDKVGPVAERAKERGLGGVDAGVVIRDGKEQRTVFLDQQTLMAMQKQVSGEIRVRVSDERTTVESVRSDGIGMNISNGPRGAR